MRNTTTKNSRVIDISREFVSGQLIIADAALLIAEPHIGQNYPAAKHDTSLVYDILKMGTFGEDRKAVITIATSMSTSEARELLDEPIRLFTLMTSLMGLPTHTIRKYYGQHGEVEDEFEDQGFDAPGDIAIIEIRVLTKSFWKTRDPSTSDWAPVLSGFELMGENPVEPITSEMMDDYLIENTDPNHPIILVAPYPNEEGFTATLYGIPQ